MQLVLPIGQSKFHFSLEKHILNLCFSADRAASYTCKRRVTPVSFTIDYFFTVVNKVILVFKNEYPPIYLV